jgi:hypothetical protein
MEEGGGRSGALIRALMLWVLNQEGVPTPLHAIGDRSPGASGHQAIISN